MSEEQLEKQKLVASGVKERAAYTTKDFQLDVLGQLAEMQALTQALQESLTNELRKNQERGRLLNFDGRTLVAIGAIALSLTGYVLQDARNTTKRDAEIESTTARIANLERTAEANTEGRIKAEVQLEELHGGQEEIKAMIQAHDNASKKIAAQKSTGGQGRE